MIKKLLTVVAIVIAVLFIAFLALGFYRTSKPENSTPAKAYRSFSTDKYTFYFPSTYVREEKKGDEELVYENPKTKAYQAESMFLNIDNVPGGLKSPNFEACNKVSETFRQSSEDKMTVRVAFGQTVGEGCEITIVTPIPGTSDSAVINQKTLWKPGSTDTNIYTVRAVYYGVASADQADLLRNSVLQFTLK